MLGWCWSREAVGRGPAAGELLAWGALNFPAHDNGRPLRCVPRAAAFRRRRPSWPPRRTSPRTARTQHMRCAAAVHPVVGRCAAARRPSTAGQVGPRPAARRARVRPVHPILRAAAERQLGLFTAVDARRAGYRHPEIQLPCSTGRWVRLRRGVYTAGRTPRGRRGTGSEAPPRLLRGAVGPRPSRLGGEPRLGRPPPRPAGPPRPRPEGAADRSEPVRRGRDFLLTRAPLPDGHVVASGPLRLTSAARTLVDRAREWGAVARSLTRTRAVGGEAPGGRAALPRHPRRPDRRRRPRRLVDAGGEPPPGAPRDARAGRAPLQRSATRPRGATHEGHGDEPRRAQPANTAHGVDRLRSARPVSTHSAPGAPTVTRE